MIPSKHEILLSKFKEEVCRDPDADFTSSIQTVAAEFRKMEAEREQGVINTLFLNLYALDAHSLRRDLSKLAIDAYILRCDYDGPYRGYIWRVENTVKAFQSYINCTLLRVVSLTPEIVIICQDAAKLWQFSFNPDPLNRAWMDGEKIHDFFRGNILCVRRSRSGNEFASIKHEDIAEIERRLLPLKTISEGEG